MYVSFLEYKDGRIEGITVHWNKQEAYEHFPFGVDENGYDAEGYSDFGTGPFIHRLIAVDKDITKALESCIKLGLATNKREYLDYDWDTHGYEWDESEYIVKEGN